MASPQKHPKTGVYRFRKRVPDHLRPLVGKAEEVHSLGTKDPAEAKARWLKVAVEIEERWARLEQAEANRRRGEQPLTRKQVAAIAGELYRAEVGAHSDEPGKPDRWRRELATDRRLDALRRRLDRTVCPIRFMTGWSGAEQQARKRYGDRVDAYLRDQGLVVGAADYKRLVLAVADAATQAHATLLRHAENDYAPDPSAGRFPPREVLAPLLPAAAPQKTTGLPWRDIVDGYAAERGIDEKTKRSWRKVLGDLLGFAGVAEPRELTKAHVVAWKAKLLADGMNPKTIREGRLAAVKAILNWAVANDHLPENPATGVTIAKVKPARTREQGFTLEEAEKILRATLAPPPPRLSRDRADARRWVPWLCAYTGARVNEITQMRVSDLELRRVPGHESVWVIRITPEAGQEKTNTFRDIPLHPHLIEQGFVRFVQAAAAEGRERLFFDPGRAITQSETHPLYQKTGEKLAEWVRETVGVDDPRIRPNHAWRHRFKSLARDVGMDQEIRDLIQGHAPRTIGEGYGDLWPRVMLRELSKLPRYDVQPT